MFRCLLRLSPQLVQILEGSRASCFQRSVFIQFGQRGEQNTYHYWFVFFRTSVFLSFDTRPTRAMLVEYLGFQHDTHGKVVLHSSGVCGDASGPAGPAVRTA